MLHCRLVDLKKTLAELARLQVVKYLLIGCHGIMLSIYSVGATNGSHDEAQGLHS